MENNEDPNQNINFQQNYNFGGSNNINDNNVHNYINQTFLPKPYTFSNNDMTPQNIPNQPQYNIPGLQRNILFISNLPYNTNETDIKLFFKNYGDAVTLTTMVPKHHYDSDTKSMSAKVIFKDSATANRARIEMNLRKLKGHAIRLMWEERDNSMRYNSTTNIFVNRIPFHVQPREVYEYFLQFGDISSAFLKDDSEGNHLGYGYVTYYDPQSAANAIQSTNGKMLWGGGPLQVDYFKRKTERISTSGPELSKLYISNFPGTFTEEQIADLVKDFGTVLSINISTEKVGRKYALVCYKSEEDCLKAKEALDGKNVYGYNLLCKITKEKNNYNENKYKNNNEQKNYTNKRFFQKNSPGLQNSEDNKCNLYIKNIPYQIKEDEFKQIFEKYGKIYSAKLVCYNVITQIGGKFNSVPTSKGFGYVCYEDPLIAKKVKEELNEHYLPGYEGWKHPLIINYFQTKSQKAMNDMMMNLNNYENNNQPNTNNEANFEFHIEKYKTLSDDDKKKQYLGDYIYSQIYKSNILKDYPIEKQKEYNSKIDGMILESGNLDDIAEMCQNTEELNQKISESLSIIINQTKNG